MGFDTRLTRQQFLTTSVLGAVGAALPFRALAQDAETGKEITVDDVRAAERLAGLEFTDKQREAALAGVKEQAANLKGLRDGKIPNEVGPATVFVPQGRQPKPGRSTDVRPGRPEVTKRPASDEDLAFLTVAELGNLLRTRQVTSRELTELALSRLRRYGPKLRCVVTLIEDDARRQADRMDREAADGRWRGPLHGIPCGVKDLFATKGHRTTWGAEPYREQVIDADAAVVERLREAGAVLCAKLSLGALAMADHWFEGLTLNPWDPKQGSSGSSAGSASAVAAGLVPFTIGTETLGSIMSPSQRCRVTGLRPTFGRISRHGAMALSWTMDKVGPICRTAEDCALVLAALHGHDPRDPASVDRPFRYRPAGELSKLKIGYLATERLDDDDISEDVGQALDILVSKGANPKPVTFSRATRGVDELLSVEAAAAFDEITRDGRVDTIQQTFWPGIFRTARFVTGVDYVQCLRERSRVMARFEEEFGEFDLCVAPERGGHTLFTTNLTGHPQLFVPMGLNAAGRPIGVSLVGRLYDEGTILAVGDAIQRATRVFRERPSLAGL